MALHTLGTNGTTSLNAITWNPSPNTLLPADCAAIYQSIIGDSNTRATNPIGVVCTGSTHSSTTLDTLVAVAGAPLSTIQVGMLVLGVGIPPGTYVARVISSTSVQLSQAATATAAGVKIVMGSDDRITDSGLIIGQLRLPGGRGMIIVQAGDVVAIDNTGWPIVVSAASIAYGGSLWTFT